MGRPAADRPKDHYKATPFPHMIYGMKIELKVMDNDGNCEIECDDEGMQVLIEKGFNAIIKDYLAKLEEENKDE